MKIFAQNHVLTPEEISQKGLFPIRNFRKEEI